MQAAMSRGLLSWGGARLELREEGKKQRRKLLRVEALRPSQCGGYDEAGDGELFV